MKRRRAPGFTRLVPVRIEPEALTWRVYPDPKSRLYCRVFVHPTKAAMTRAANVVGAFHATCVTLTVRKYGKQGYVRTVPVFAEVHFYRRRLGTRFVVHEFLHATMAWARRRGWDLTTLDKTSERARVVEVEEQLCYAHDRMVGAFVDRAYALRLYP